MFVLVLDDQLSAADEAGVLQAGRNRSEHLYELIIESGHDAMLYDGRAANGMSELESGREAAEEIVRRLVSKFPTTSEEQPIECQIVLDLKWFDDEDYGRQILENLTDCKILSVGKVVIWSVITDKSVRRRFLTQFEVPADHVLDRAAAPAERVLRLFGIRAESA